MGFLRQRGNTDQIYGIIQPFGWQAKVSGSI